MKKRSIWAVFIFLLLAATVAMALKDIVSGDVQEGQVSKKKRPTTVEAVEASTATISQNLELTGSVEPCRVARLASPAEGPVVDILVREGDVVQPNEPLLFIGRKGGVDAKIVSLREVLKKEKDRLRRARQLHQGEFIADEQLDQVRADYEKAKAELVQAEETARDYTIHAPWEGVVTNLLVKEGEFVAPREALLEMYDPSSLVIRAAVPEKHARQIVAGMQVDVHLDAFLQSSFQGRVDRVYPYLDSQLRTRTLEILLDKPVHLLPGMFARLKMALQTADDSVVLPSEAVVQTAKGQAVFAVEAGRALRRPVESGIEAGNRIQIVSGVKPGEMIIVAGNEKLKDGAMVSLAGSDGPGMDQGKGPGKGKTAGKGADGNSTRHADDAFPAAGASQ